MATRKSTSARKVLIVHPTRRKAAKPRKAREPKFHDVNGYRLTPKQYREYSAHLQEIRRRFEPQGWSRARCEERALSDCLYRWRLDMWSRLMDAAPLLASLKNFPLWLSSPESRRIGNSIILRVADELRAVEQNLREIHAGIASEDAEVRS